MNDRLLCCAQLDFILNIYSKRVILLSAIVSSKPLCEKDQLCKNHCVKKKPGSLDRNSLEFINWKRLKDFDFIFLW